MCQRTHAGHPVSQHLACKDLEDRDARIQRYVVVEVCRPYQNVCHRNRILKHTESRNDFHSYCD